jgi:DNA-binding response OmpR family regulator
LRDVVKPIKSPGARKTNEDPALAKILLVEDEEAILFAFKKMLGGPDLTVDTASTLAEALQLLKENSYRAVIADLRLSGAAELEGLDVVREARAVQRDCRIIVATAFATNEIREKVFELGADIYLEKPVSPQKVKEVLRTLGVISA